MNKNLQYTWPRKICNRTCEKLNRENVSLRDCKKCVLCKNENAWQSFSKLINKQVQSTKCNPIRGYFMVFCKNLI